MRSYTIQHDPDIRKTYSQILTRLARGLFKNLKTVIVEYKLFPLYTSWTTLINALSQAMPALLLAIFFSAETAGYYALANRVLIVPIGLVGNSVRQVYYQRATELYNNGESIFPLFKKMTLNLAMMGLVPVIIMIIWGSEIFGIALGSSWEEAGLYASIITMWLFVFFIDRPGVATILILELNQIQLIIEILLLVFRLIALLAGALIFKNIYITLGLFTIVGLIFNLFFLFYIYSKLKRAHTHLKE